MKLIGLPNIGNTCYLNSALQLLISCQLLTNYCLQSNQDSKIFQIFKTFLTNYKNQNITSSNVMEFKNNVVKNKELLMFKNFNQHDSHEFLVKFLDSLESEFKTINSSVDYQTDKLNKSLIQILFENNYNSSIKCSECQNVSITKQYTKIFSFDMQNFDTLQDCMKSDEETITLEGVNQYQCDVCNKKTNAIKINNNEYKSKYLIIHLKRLTFYRNQIIKKNHIVKIDEFIEPHYYLRGFIHHSGGSTGGHYVVYLKDKSTWYMISDQSVTKIANPTIPRDRSVIYLYVRNSNKNSATQ